MSLPLIPLGLLGRSVAPSFPILRSTNVANLGPGQTIALPAGVQAGDLVIVAYFVISTLDIGSLPTPSGWTNHGVLNLSPGGVDTHLLKIISREAPSALSSVVVTWTGDASGVCSNSYCFSLWTDISVSAFVEADSASPNPPALTPSGWGPSPRATWISLMATRGSVEDVSATSSGFAGTLDSDVGSSPYGRVLSSRRDEQAASLNPGAWSMTGSMPWGAATLAVRGT